MASRVPVFCGGTMRIQLFSQEIIRIYIEYMTLFRLCHSLKWQVLFVQHRIILLMESTLFTKPSLKADD